MKTGLQIAGCGAMCRKIGISRTSDASASTAATTTTGRNRAGDADPGAHSSNFSVGTPPGGGASLGATMGRIRCGAW